MGVRLGVRQTGVSSSTLKLSFHNRVFVLQTCKRENDSTVPPAGLLWDHIIVSNNVNSCLPSNPAKLSFTLKRGGGVPFCFCTIICKPPLSLLRVKRWPLISEVPHLCNRGTRSRRIPPGRSRTGSPPPLCGTRTDP